MPEIVSTEGPGEQEELDELDKPVPAEPIPQDSLQQMPTNFNDGDRTASEAPKDGSGGKDVDEIGSAATSSTEIMIRQKALEQEVERLNAKNRHSEEALIAAAESASGDNAALLKRVSILY